TPACQASQDGLQEFTHPTGGVTMPEEDRRVRVFFGGRLVDDLSQVGRKLLVLGGTCLNIGPGPAGFVDVRFVNPSPVPILIRQGLTALGLVKDLRNGHVDRSELRHANGLAGTAPALDSSAPR